MTFRCQGSFHINSSNITGHHCTVTISKFTRVYSFEAQYLAVLRKYLIKLKLFCLFAKNLP